MGTAGHIDHGKTLLVKALTGIDCDTHAEEKKRGITIHLGFAHLDFASGEKVGIVDMPGHKDFIHTMVSGASGIDIALLVISADSGIMPQTREHLWIMQTLGIAKGLVAMTKTDIVDAETAEIAEDDIRSFIAETFLENCPIVRVSSVTGSGIEALRKEIHKLIEGTEPRSGEGIFRMYPDRIFSVPGFGSVLTGSVIEGKIRKDAKLFMLPGAKKEYRIRRMERHGSEADEIYAGDRASINLAGLEREEFVKGNLLSDRDLAQTKMLDARISLFRDGRKIHVWSNAIFLVGTHEQQARIHLLSSDVLKPGDSGDAQMHLSKPIAARYGDRFIIRSTSDDCTLGGGFVTDVFPLHHRRRTAKLKEKAAGIAAGGVVFAVVEEVNKKGGVARLSDVSNSMNIHENHILKALDSGKGKSMALLPYKNDFIIIKKEEEISVRKRIPSLINSFTEKNPLLNRGPSLEEIKGAAYARKNNVFADLLALILDDMRKKGEIEKKGENWSVTGKKDGLDPRLLSQVETMEKFLEESGIKVPRYEELAEYGGRFNISEKELKLVLNYLVQTKKAHRIEGEYISVKIADKAKESLKKAMAGAENGITVAQFRDLIGANRKLCLLLFALFDSEGFTVRRGDLRFLKKNI